MNEIQTLDYNRQILRITHIQQKTWWAFCDVGKILGFVREATMAKRLDSEELFCGVVKNKNFGGRRLKFINSIGLYKVIDHSVKHIDETIATNFKHWLEEKFPDIFNLATETEVKAVLKLSIQVSLQKAQMLIRIAENKAVPYSEQLRLLDLAVKELTGTGLNLEVVNGVQPIDSKKTAVCVDIMELPEVVGFIHKKETKLVDGVKIKYLTANMIGKKWRNSSNNTFSGKDFSEFADDYGDKEPKFGYWQRVMTPNGDAREFMYLDGTMLDYMNKKFGRVA